jgi:hypothetical protein
MLRNRQEDMTVGTRKTVDRYIQHRINTNSEHTQSVLGIKIR